MGGGAGGQRGKEGGGSMLTGNPSTVSISSASPRIVRQ